MFRLFVLRSLALATLLAAVSAIAQTTNPAPVFTSLAPIPFATDTPVLSAGIDSEKPFTVAGERGMFVGRQSGVLEAWILPVKVLSNLTLEARIHGYTVPIEVNPQAAHIEVRPDRTVLTYAHMAFTVRETLFSPAGAPAGAGPIALFEFDCLHPTDFTFRFTPHVQWMWPARNDAAPGPDWVSPDPRNPNAAGGYFVFRGNYPDLAAAITIPGAEPDSLAPTLDRPPSLAPELTVHIDPARDRGRLYPLLMTVGNGPAATTPVALGHALAALNQQIPALYAAHAEAWKQLLAHATSIETPDASLNEAFLWSVISIEQLRTRVPSTARLPNSPPDETALVAGYFNSNGALRPGFGWFFGRDALFTIPALHGFGDFALSRSELEFLMLRQRADGKIMHEYSQTASAVDWQQWPYMWAAADSTPLFLLAMADYVRATGDTAFLAAHRDAIDKAWAFETDPAHDTDHDGIYDNSQGTAWVESWPGGMPHQEIYLAALDQQGSAAYAYLMRALKETAKAEAAGHRAQTIAKTINAEYYDAQKGCYAFSRDLLKDGSTTLDRTASVYPSLAWWSDLPGTANLLDHPAPCLRQFVASGINTDWGTRDIANNEPIYDGMSYHQGTVWPLFTGWAALAEYRGGQPLAGYQLLKENANLTRAQDLGSHTELLSGDFYFPMARSTSHQLWSSAMVITPTLRGLFGISIDAPTKTITVNPHLPADWKFARLRNLQLPGGDTEVVFSRDGASLHINLSPAHAIDGWHLRSDLPGAQAEKGVPFGLVLPLPLVEIGEPAHDVPVPGARASAFRVLDEKWETNKVTLTVEGLAGSTASLPVYRHKPVKLGLQTSGGLSNVADINHPTSDFSTSDTAWRDASMPFALSFHFPPGSGWTTMTVTLTW